MEIENDASITNEAKETLTNWKIQPLKLLIGVDIGGTNARVAAINLHHPQEDYLVLVKFKASSKSELLTKLELVGKQILNITNTTPFSACLAIAGPIEENGTKVSITNYIGEDVTIRVSDLPTNFFPSYPKTVFINDLASTCEGISSLSENGKLFEFFQPLWGAKTDFVMKPENYIVLAMGTGLGCGCLHYKNNGHEVIPLEFGHSSISQYGPSHKNHSEEQSLIAYISNKLYQQKNTIEWEDTCSGRGLVYCYEWATKDIPEAPKNLGPAEIVARALNNPPDYNAEKAVQTHYKYLFRIAQQLCIGLIGKAVFLAGDNQVNNDPAVSKYVEIFREEFLDSTKLNWIQNVPIFRQIKLHNLNLVGCMFVAKRIARN